MKVGHYRSGVWKHLAGAPIAHRAMALMAHGPVYRGPWSAALYYKLEVSETPISPSRLGSNAKFRLVSRRDVP